MTSANRFGYEWEKYYWLSPDYEIQFQKWLGLFGLEIFQNKKVLDAGCGMGRNSFWALKYGAEELMAFDFDQRTVEAAKKNLAPFPNAQVEFASIYDINWQDEFDVVFCIGVIHHLAQPRKAIEKLIDSAKSGGMVLIWVYGYEGNEWIVRFVSPWRKYITSKLPLSLLH
ncbi:MAG: class I SAM-dependent methyltransferase, partial [Patescibacteria group bacterium]